MVAGVDATRRMLSASSRFTRSLRHIRATTQLLTRADREATRCGQSVAGVEHLLLAAVALPDGSARRAFGRLGADTHALRSAIADKVAEERRVLALTRASVDTVLKCATKLANSDTSSCLQGAHVVAVIAELEHGIAAEALRELGIDRAALLDAVREELAEKR